MVYLPTHAIAETGTASRTDYDAPHHRSVIDAVIEAILSLVPIAAWLAQPTFQTERTT
jgi:hypothetical protein